MDRYVHKLTPNGYIKTGENIVMTLNAYLETMTWNEERDLMNLNLKLENDMLEEEKKEFWDDFKRFRASKAGDNKLNALTGMVDAACDYTFVAIGTDAKVAQNLTSLNDKIIIQALKADAEKQIGLMTGVLTQLLGNYFNLDTCYDLVLSANKLKPKKKDINGKNEKGTQWVDPKGPIKDYLLTIPGIEEYYIEESSKEASTKDAPAISKRSSELLESIESTEVAEKPVEVNTK